MDDKIKIHLTKEVFDTLMKDCEAFEFYKADGISLNKNAFLNSIIINYYEAYQEKENNLSKLISEVLDDETNVGDVEFVTSKIVSKINKLSISPNKEKVNAVISLKPTKESAFAFSYIEDYLLKDTTISEFFRNLFSSYASLPQDERELIIFKDQYKVILKAIRLKRVLYFTTGDKKQFKHEVYPYAFASSKEEMHNYLLAKFKGECKSYRLNRIKDCSLVREHTEFTDEDKEIFEKMLKYGPEFMYAPGESTVIIELTPKGQHMFRTHYTHRPIPDFIQEDLYYFNCSHQQIFSYFRRFGKEAFIITPRKLQSDIYEFHKKAIKHYQDENK